tara:strand:+ start:125 stop:808 length:684 start_codon:yes stop_codon:yes gene_type:complete
MIEKLSKFEMNVNSQNGEDGVLQEILKRLDIKLGTFCEFGAWDGVHLSNTYLLAQKGWKGVYIEGDSDKFNDLLETKKKHDPDQLICVNKFVSVDGENSLESILKSTEIETDFDLLSIDIDSYDYQVWESLREYTPKIVVIEVNGGLGPHAEQIHTLDGDGNVLLQGSSFASTYKLGKTKGYTCVYHCGNMIFLRNDLFNPDKFEHGYYDWVLARHPLARQFTKMSF